MDGIFLWKHECGQDLQLHLSSVKGKEWHWTPTPIKWEKTGWKNAGDVPCWNQPRQREANSGFMMNKILKIAQGIRVKRITPGRFGNSILWQWETYRWGRKYPNTKEDKRTQEGVWEGTKKNLSWEDHKIFMKPS